MITNDDIRCAVMLGFSEKFNRGKPRGYTHASMMAQTAEKYVDPIMQEYDDPTVNYSARFDAYFLRWIELEIKVSNDLEPDPGKLARDAYFHARSSFTAANVSVEGEVRKQAGSVPAPVKEVTDVDEIKS